MTDALGLHSAAIGLQIALRITESPPVVQLHEVYEMLTQRIGIISVKRRAGLGLTDNASGITIPGAN